MWSWNVVRRSIKSVAASLSFNSKTRDDQFVVAVSCRKSDERREEMFGGEVVEGASSEEGRTKGTVTLAIAMDAPAWSVAF